MEMSNPINIRTYTGFNATSGKHLAGLALNALAGIGVTYHDVSLNFVGSKIVYHTDFVWRKRYTDSGHFGHLTHRCKFLKALKLHKRYNGENVLPYIMKAIPFIETMYLVDIEMDWDYSSDIALIKAYPATRVVIVDPAEGKSLLNYSPD